MQLASEATRVSAPSAVSPIVVVAQTASAKHDEKQQQGNIQEEKKFTEKDAQKLVHEVNEHLRTTNTELNFTVDKETKKMVLKIVNTKTDEVIRQIPAEDVLRLAARMSQMLGVLVDEKS